MTKLGTWPQNIYYLSWMTQRLANRAPEYTHGRRWSWSIMQQLLNPIARDLERVNKQLVEERDNIFTSAANISLLDRLYYLPLGIGMEFSSVTEEDGVGVYTVPTVYAVIDGTEQEITIAHKNNIESLYYTALPSRVEYGEESFSYTEVIPRSTIADLDSLTPNDLLIESHLYVTLRGNTTWEYKGRERIYYPKVYIRGTTRKGTEQVEAVPIRYNGTFKTINQWKTVEEIFVSYLDDTAEITVETLAFDRDTQMDTQNLLVPVSGIESWRFLRLAQHLWGSTLISEGFTTSSFEVVRLGYDTLDHEYEIELQDAANNPIELTAMTIKPYSDYFFAVDNNSLYVYTSKLPYPDLTVLEQESPDTKMDLRSDRWLYARDDTVVIQTDILDVGSIPWKFRWMLEKPDGSQYYLGVNGSEWPLTTDAWIDNQAWEQGTWLEQRMELTADTTGAYILTLECFYSNEEIPNQNYTLVTRFLFYVPVLTPEIVLPLPTELRNASALAFDADDCLWFHVGTDIFKSNVYYDYFLADYGKRAIWLRENYTSVRMVI